MRQQAQGLPGHLVRYPTNEKLQWRDVRTVHVSRRREDQIRKVNLGLVRRDEPVCQALPSPYTWGGQAVRAAPVIAIPASQAMITETGQVIGTKLRSCHLR